MLLLVGLGNPTPDSENNRHNIGFKIIDAINKKFGLSKQKPKFKGLLTTGNVGEQKVYAIKPLTFMNNSGICIRELIEYFKIDPEDVIVFHDDLDVEFGKKGNIDYGKIGTGKSGLGTIKSEVDKDFNYTKGSVGLARSLKYDTEDSQFFIILQDEPLYEGEYTPIGKVIFGLEALEKIKHLDKSEYVLRPDFINTLRLFN